MQAKQIFEKMRGGPAAPVEAPPRPTTRPEPTTAPTRPAAPEPDDHPDPFRRRRPGIDPETLPAPKAKRREMAGARNAKSYFRH